MNRLLIVAAVAAAACDGARGQGFVSPEVADGSGHGHGSAHGPETALPRVTGWEGNCTKAFALAREASPFERFAIIARGCPVCSVDWNPVLLANEVDEHDTTAAKTMDVDAVVKACGGACSPTARDRFIGAFELVKDEPSIPRPWRQLARDCQGLLWPAPNDRFAGPAWYILTQVGHALAGVPGAPPLAIGEPLVLPLPAAHINGAGILLTPATAVLRELPARQITVMPTDVRVAPPPTVTLGPRGLVVGIADNFPGAPLAVDALDAELAAAVQGVAGAKVGLLAPIASQATRVLEVVTKVKTDVELHLEGFAPGTAGGWAELPAMMAPAIRPVPTADHVVLSIGRDKVLIGKIAGTALNDPCVADDAVAALHHAQPTADVPVVIAIETHAVVEQLAKAIDAAGAMQLPAVALAPGDSVKWPQDPVPCPP